MNKKSKYKPYMSLFMCFLFVIQAQADETSFKQLVQKINSVKDDHGVAAAAVIMVDKNQVLINSHLGINDWDDEAQFRPDNMYRIGSISKAFAGLLALRLQQKGLITLSGSIADYGLSAYLTNTFPEQTITLAQLLEHTAGLADLSKREWDYNKAEPISLKQAFGLKLGAHKTHWTPGMFRSYSNVGPGLFGLALEIKLGETYETLMQKHVFEPLQMKSSGLLLNPEVKENLITGYDRDGKTQIKYWHNVYRPFAAINTNNQDMIKFLQMLLQDDHSFLSQTDRKRLVTPSSSAAAKNGLNYGYGLGVYQWQTEGHSFFGHGGDADGYLTRFGYNPESGLAYFVMINAFKHKPLNQMIRLIEQHIIDELPKPMYPKRLKLVSSDVERYVGEYLQITQRFGVLQADSSNRLSISNDDEQLSYQLNFGRKINIHSVRKDQFRTTDQSTSTMFFTSHQDKQFFLGEVGNFVKVSDECCETGR